MADPITITASAIATLAFQKFIESSAGDLAKKFTSAAINTMGTLANRIWAKMKGKAHVETIKTEIEQTHKMIPEQVDKIATYLEVAMDEDEKFADEIRMLAHEINAGKVVDQSSTTQNIHDHAKGWQTTVEGGTAHIGEIHIDRKSD